MHKQNPCFIAPRVSYTGTRLVCYLSYWKELETRFTLSLHAIHFNCQEPKGPSWFFQVCYLWLQAGGWGKKKSPELEKYERKNSLIKGRKKLRLFIMQLSLLSKFPYICDTVYLPYVFHPTALLIDHGPCSHLKAVFFSFCCKLLIPKMFV